MQKRPLRITVVATLIILVTVIGGALSMSALTSPDGITLLEEAGYSVPLVLFLMIVSILLGLVTGVAILQGQNWGRLLYLIGQAVSQVLSWIFSPTSAPEVVMGIVIYVVVLWLLTGKDAGAYFHGKPLPEAAPRALRGQWGAEVKSQILDALQSNDDTDKQWALAELESYAAEGVEEAQEIRKRQAL